jgi:hypothetical protein
MEVGTVFGLHNLKAIWCVGIGSLSPYLWIWRGALRHEVFQVDCMTGMFSFCSHGVKRPKTPISPALARRTGER